MNKLWATFDPYDQHFLAQLLLLLFSNSLDRPLYKHLVENFPVYK